MNSESRHAARCLHVDDCSHTKLLRNCSEIKLTTRAFHVTANKIFLYGNLENASHALLAIFPELEHLSTRCHTSKLIAIRECSHNLKNKKVSIYNQPNKPLLHFPFLFFTFSFSYFFFPSFKFVC